MSPWSAGVGQGGSGDHVRTSGDLLRWTQSCPRTGGALSRPVQATTETQGAQACNLSTKPTDDRQRLNTMQRLRTALLCIVLPGRR